MADFTFLLENVSSLATMTASAADAADMDVTTTGTAFHSARGHGLSMLAIGTEASTRRLIKEQHGVNASLRMYFGVRAKHQNDAKDTMIIAVNDILTSISGDALLISKDGKIILWRENNKLFLNSSSKLWDSYRFELMEGPFLKTPL